MNTNERELARADYLQHVRTCIKAGLHPEPFERYAIEWASVRRVNLPADDDVDRHASRDYSVNYGGRGKGERI